MGLVPTIWRHADPCDRPPAGSERATTRPVPSTATSKAHPRYPIPCRINLGADEPVLPAPAPRSSDIFTPDPPDSPTPPRRLPPEVRSETPRTWCFRFLLRTSPHVSPPSASETNSAHHQGGFSHSSPTHPPHPPPGICHFRPNAPVAHDRSSPPQTPLAYLPTRRPLFPPLQPHSLSTSGAAPSCTATGACEIPRTANQAWIRPFPVAATALTTVFTK